MTELMDKITQLCDYIEKNNSQNSSGTGSHIYDISVDTQDGLRVKVNTELKLVAYILTKNGFKFSISESMDAVLTVQASYGNMTFMCSYTRKELEGFLAAKNITKAFAYHAVRSETIEDALPEDIVYTCLLYS